MSFRYYQRRDCPICNGARNDCRQNTQTGIIHCRDGSANPIGWHLIREDAQGFLMWAEGDGKDGISKEEREKRQQDKWNERQRREEEKRRGALPVEARDIAIRRLHKHFGLAQRHRDDLKRRGLTDEQIDKLLFFTIQPGERVPMGVPENLPGVKNGRICGTQGYACIVFDEAGRAIGWQIRLDNPDENGGKYHWGKGARSSHLPNGELPITIATPLVPIRRQAIGMSEGILKPQVAANKLGQIFIGASGFMFSKSVEGADGKEEKVTLEQLKPYLAAASNELGGTKDIDLYPDGGVVKNPQMYQKYQWLWDALAKLGYKVRIAWWGQIDKDKPDCDELPENAEIKLISPGTFADYAKRFGGADSAWMQKVRREWKAKRKFTPDITSCSQFVNWDRPADNTVFFGRGGLGSGKTTQFRKWAKEWRAEDPDTRFFVLGYRNTLLKQTVSNMSKDIKGLQHVHDAEAILRKDHATSFALCVDSLLKFQPEDFDDSVVFLDEVVSVVRHLLLSPTIPNHKRNRILQLFEEAIQRARTVVCMDGLMADWVCEYIAAIAGDSKKIIKAENTFKGNKPIINFLLGTEDFDEKIKPNDRSPLLKLMLEQAPVPVICSDSRIFLEGMDEIFTARGAKTLRLDSKTVPEDYATEFLGDPNKYIREHEIDVLLYSPSAESGLDVSLTDWFTHQFCFFFGVLGVDPIIQMVGRIRDSEVQRFLWCKEWVAADEREHSKSPFVEEVERNRGWIIQEDVAQSTKSEGLRSELSEELLDQIAAKARETIKQSSNIHFKTYCLIKSIENAEKANLRSFLREALLKEGYGINEVILPTFDDCKELEKEAKEAVKRTDSRDIFTAPVQDEEIQKLASTRLQFDAKWEDRCKRIKAVLLDRLPGIRESGVWSEDFIYLTQFEDKEFLNRQKLFWLYNHPEEAEKEGIRRLHWLARTEKTFIGNIKSRFLKIQAYRQLEIHRFFDLDASWSDSSPEIQDLLERCKEPKIAKVLGHPGKMGGIQNLSRLLKPLGLKQKSFKPHEGDRLYKIDSEKFFAPNRLEVIRAIGSRYEKAKLEEKPLDWNQIFEPTGENQGAAPPPISIYINTGGGAAPGTFEKSSVSADSEFLPESGLETTGADEKSVEEPGSEFLSSEEIQWMAADFIPLIAQSDAESLKWEVQRLCKNLAPSDLEKISQACEASIWQEIRERIGTELAALLPVRENPILEESGEVAIEKNPEPTGENQGAAPPPISIYINKGSCAAPETLGKSTVSAETGKNSEGWQEKSESTATVTAPPVKIPVIIPRRRRKVVAVVPAPTAIAIPSLPAPAAAAVLEKSDPELEEKPLDWNQIFEPTGENQGAAPPPISIYINNGGGAAPETLVNSTVSAEMGRKPETGLEPTGADEKSVPDRVPQMRGIIAIPRKKVYGQLLVQAFEYGIETFKDLLKPWTQQERWEAIREFERLAPESMERLHSIAPNWFEWCDAL